jgi:hypothetical protein
VLAYNPLVIIFKNGNGYVVPGGSDQIYQFKISRLRQTLRQTYEFTRGMCGPVKCCSVDTSSSIFARSESKANRRCYMCGTRKTEIDAA